MPRRLQPLTGGAFFRSVALEARATAAVAVFLLTAGIATAVLRADERVIADSAQLRQAVRTLGAGVTLLLEPGDYEGGLFIEDRHGREGAPVVIRGRDPERPPRLRGGGQALHLSDCSHVTLAHLRVEGLPSNGINIDDGGDYATPAHHIIVEDVVIENTGPRGNHDALKLSGLDDFVVRSCRFEGWGGSAIDMVGCHRGTVTNCIFRGRDGFSQSNAVQMKGGSSDLLVERCFFADAGERAINLGGSTGAAYFRPQGTDYEATRITVAGNRFVGCGAAVAWVNARGGRVHHNTIYRPSRWVLRILEESCGPRFVPCQGGVFEENLVVFDGGLRTFVNVGPDTAPESFRFRRNAWFDAAGSRRPELPVGEEGGIYQIDPEIRRAGEAAMEASSSRAELDGIGARGYRERASDAGGHSDQKQT